MLRALLSSVGATDATDVDDGGNNLLVIILLIVAAVVILAVVAFLIRRQRAGVVDREVTDSSSQSADGVDRSRG